MGERRCGDEMKRKMVGVKQGKAVRELRNILFYLDLLVKLSYLYGRIAYFMLHQLVKSVCQNVLYN